MKFIQAFNQLAIFAVLVTVLGTCASMMMADAQCPGNQSTYEANCDIAKTLAGRGYKMTDSDRESCVCAAS